MDCVFPDASAKNYDHLIPGIQIPDPDDRHVVAAALRSRADVIVTNNLKDCPPSITEEFDIEIQPPDLFLSTLYDSYPARSIAAFKKQVSRLKNPPLPEAKLLAIFQEQGLQKMAERLKSEIE